jgi:hypothetical protein
MLSQFFAYVGRVVHTGLKLIEQTVKTWTKPNTATVVINALADMTRTKPELIAENALLRQQLIVLHLSVKRPKFTASVRWLMVLLAGSGALLETGAASCPTGYTLALASGPVSVGVATQEPSHTWSPADRGQRH